MQVALNIRTININDQELETLLVLSPFSMEVHN